MSSLVKKVGFVFPLLLAACAGEKSPASQTGPTVGGLTDPSISTDSASYSLNATITVTYDGLPGNEKDWIAIAPAGSDNTSYTAFVYTGGQTSGTATFSAPAPGSYVARAFSNDTYDLIGESPPFTVAVTGFSTDRTSYSLSDTITVTYSGLPGNEKRSEERRAGTARRASST